MRTFYVNGNYVEEDKACVSVLDRGFLFADAVYEVTSVLGGRLVDNAAHLARLRRSLDALRMSSPMSDDELQRVQIELIRRNRLDEGGVYLQVTRGVADRDFAFPDSATEPGLVMFTQAKPIVQNPWAKKGINVISIEDIRWQRRDIKTVGLLGASLAKQAALDAGVQDAWMVEDGMVTEGSSNNAYIVTADGTIQTRQIGPEILAGITRRAVLGLCEKTQRKVLEKPFTVDDVKNASEAFITSASTFVLPVVSIDGHRIGDGQPGPVASALRQLYIELAAENSLNS